MRRCWIYFLLLLLAVTQLFRSIGAGVGTLVGALLVIGWAELDHRDVLSRWWSALRDRLPRLTKGLAATGKILLWTLALAYLVLIYGYLLRHFSDQPAASIVMLTVPPLVFAFARWHWRHARWFRKAMRRMGAEMNFDSRTWAYATYISDDLSFGIRRQGQQVTCHFHLSIPPDAPTTTAESQREAIDRALAALSLTAIWQPRYGICQICEVWMSRREATTQRLEGLRRIFTDVLIPMTWDGETWGMMHLTDEAGTPCTLWFDVLSFGISTAVGCREPADGDAEWGAWYDDWYDYDEEEGDSEPSECRNPVWLTALVRAAEDHLGQGKGMETISEALFTNILHAADPQPEE